MLRDRRSATAIELYTQSPMAQRIAAQESVLSAILKQPDPQSENWKGTRTQQSSCEPDF
jgi:hypothetical protein